VQDQNRQNCSLSEYAWVRQVYAALGYGVPSLDPQEMLRQIGGGSFNPRGIWSSPLHHQKMCEWWNLSVRGW
jgi:hypothetical protein